VIRGHRNVNALLLKLEHIAIGKRRIPSNKCYVQLACADRPEVLAAPPIVDFESHSPRLVPKLRDRFAKKASCKRSNDADPDSAPFSSTGAPAFRKAVSIIRNAGTTCARNR
jgi:hypothetical protein